jgi:DNA-directed RNA polymerase subunit RPC12/RpoP
MIIACPDCSGPYQLPDDQIAPLVQVECPHCTYRIILDFAAANDASLVEDGMQMASGYVSEADYRAAAGAAPAARAAPQPAAKPAAKPAAQKPAAAPAQRPAAKPTPAPTPKPAAPPTPKPASGPVRSPVPDGARAPEAATGESASSDTGRTILGQPPISIPPAPPEHRAKTPAPLELTDKLEAQKKAAAEAAAPPTRDEVIELTERAEEEEAEVEEVEAEVEEAEVEAEVEEVEAEVEEAKAEPEEAEARRPPHTPPAKAASTPPPASEEEAEVPATPSPAELSAAGMSSPDVEPEPKSRAALYLLIGLLLIGGALVGFSFYETGDPNPMPLIEELIQSYTG